MIPASHFPTAPFCSTAGNYRAPIKWALEKRDTTAKHGVDISIVSSYSDILEEGEHLETKTNKLLDLAIYADRWMKHPP